MAQTVSGQGENKHNEKSEVRQTALNWQKKGALFVTPNYIAHADNMAWCRLRLRTRANHY